MVQLRFSFRPPTRLYIVTPNASMLNPHNVNGATHGWRLRMAAARARMFLSHLAAHFGGWGRLCLLEEVQ